MAFAELFLLDAASGVLDGGNKHLAATQIGCFAPSAASPDIFVPGYLFLNHFVETATFRGFAAIRRGRWIGRIIGLIILLGMLFVLAAVLAFITVQGEPWRYEGPSAFENFKFGFLVLAGLIALIVIIIALGRFDKTSARALDVLIPEDIRAYLQAIYAQQKLLMAETKVASAPPPPSLTAKVGTDLAGSAVKHIAATLLPSGLASVATSVAMDAVKSDTAEAAINTVRDAAVVDMLDALLARYCVLTGRKLIGLEPGIFAGMRLTSLQELTALSRPD